MLKFLIWSFLFFIFVSCTNTGIDSEEVIARFSNPKIDAGYIVIPVEPERFIIIDNSIMRSRVYYDYYKETFHNYEAFLKKALMCPGAINYCETISICDDYDYKQIEKLKYRINYLLFAKHYLYELNKGVFTIKSQYQNKWPYILAYCFSHGYYLYFSDYAAEWIISETPEDNLNYYLSGQ